MNLSEIKYNIANIIQLYVGGVYIKLKIEMLEPYNNLLVLLPGVIFDLIGSVAYYRTVQKVDLKLA